jgi:hypothetical protein
VDLEIDEVLNERAGSFGEHGHQLLPIVHMCSCPCSEKCDDEGDAGTCTVTLDDKAHRTTGDAQEEHPGKRTEPYLEVFFLVTYSHIPAFAVRADGEQKPGDEGKFSCINHDRVLSAFCKSDEY